jgi:hypothetical protein
MRFLGPARPSGTASRRCSGARTGQTCYCLAATTRASRTPLPAASPPMFDEIFSRASGFARHAVPPSLFVNGHADLAEPDDDRCEPTAIVRRKSVIVRDAVGTLEGDGIGANGLAAPQTSMFAGRLDVTTGSFSTSPDPFLATTASRSRCSR